MLEQFQHSALRRVDIDGDGLTIVLTWSAPVRVAWNDIKLVSVIPAVVRGPEGWRAKYDASKSAYAKYGLVMDLRKFLVLDIVVCDRRVLLARCSNAWGRISLHGALRAMRDADDRICPDEALLRVEVRAPQLRHGLDALLDTIAAHCRLGLVVDF